MAFTASKTASWTIAAKRACANGLSAGFCVVRVLHRDFVPLQNDVGVSCFGAHASNTHRAMTHGMRLMSNLAIPTS